MKGAIDHTLSLYQLPIDTVSGGLFGGTDLTPTTFTYDPDAAGTHEGEITVRETGDATFHDDFGRPYTDPSGAGPNIGDPNGSSDQMVLSNTLDPTANGLTIHTAGQYMLTGNDGTQFLIFSIVTGSPVSSDPWSNHDAIFVSTQPLVEGVIYDFEFVTPGVGGSGGVLAYATVDYSELVAPCFCRGTKILTTSGKNPLK